MKYKDCLWKKSLGEIALFHVRSAYQVMVNEETLGVLFDMCGKSEDQLTERQRGYYEKLHDQNMMEPGAGTIPEERSQSPLVQMELEVAARCNLTCKHCFAQNAGGLMDFELIASLFADALKLGAIVVSINGGEPLLHPRIHDILRLAREHNFRTDLFTNAVLITKEFCEKIAPLGLDKVYVSLDGFSEKHDMVRGEGNFAKTVRGIRLLREHGIRVWINSMLHRGNEADLPAFGKFCLEDLRVNGLRFSSVHPLGKARENRELFLFPQKTKNALADLPNGEEQSLKQDNMLRCRAGIKGIYVAAKGEVYPCNYFRRAEMCMGSVYRKKLEELYHENMEKESIFTSFDHEKLEKCKGCSFFSTCGGGCRARALLLGNDIYGKDPISCANRGLADDIPNNP